MPLPLLCNSYALLIAGLLAISSSVGQSENRDPHFTPTAARTTSYMPRVIIRNMREDRVGNIWFATFGGAIRYDGKSLRRFTQKDGLSSLTVYCMLEDKAGNIWFGSADAGACRFDGKTFTNFSATNPPRLPARPAQAPSNDQTSAIARGEAVSEMSKNMRQQASCRVRPALPNSLPRF